MKIAIATKNLGKFNEFKELSVDTDYEFIQIPSSVQEMPPENGTSFYANALIKAKYISNYLGIPAIGDDSGLEVDAIEGRPGIFSARYSSSGTDMDNCLKLLDELKNIKESHRTGRFKCSLVAYYKGKIVKSSGTLEGSIAKEFKGSNGFGYDPIFIVESGKHLAEFKKGEKNLISHRAKAFKSILFEIHKLFA